MVVYKDKYGRIDPNSTGLKAGVNLQGGQLQEGGTPIGTVRTEGVIDPNEIAANQKAVFQSKQRNVSAANKASVDNQYAQDDLRKEQAVVEEGYKKVGDLYYKNGVYYHRRNGGTYVRATAEELLNRGIQEVATKQTKLFNDQGEAKTPEQIAAEEMGLEYRTPEQKNQDMLEELNSMNRLEQKLIKQQAKTDLESAAAARSTAEAIAGGRPSGISSASMNMLSAEGLARVQRQQAVAGEELASRQATLERVKQQEADGQIARGSLQVQAAQAAVTQQQAKMDADAAALELKSKSKAEEELAFIASGEEFANMTPEEQEATIAGYSQIPESIRSTIAANAVKARADQETSAMIAGTESAAGVIASQIIAGAELSYESMQSLAKTSYFTADQIAGYQAEAKSIQAGKGSTEEKDAAMADLSRRIRGEAIKAADSIATESTKNFDYYQALLNAGETKLAKQFASEAGIDTDAMSTPGGYVGEYTSGEEITSSVVGGTFVTNLPEGYDGSLSRVEINGEVKPGKQCGEYVNDVIGVPSYVKNSIDDKKGLARDDESNGKDDVKPGDIFVENIGSYGHVGFVKRVYKNENGETVIDTDEFNYKEDQEKSDRTGQPLSKFYGFGNNSSLAKDNSLVISNMAKSYQNATDTRKGEIEEEIRKMGGEQGLADFWGEIMDADAILGKVDKIPIQTNMRKEIGGADRFQAYDELQGQVGKMDSALEGLKGLDPNKEYSLDEIQTISPQTQAILVGFQKILDPTSVVRESEYNRSAEDLAVADKAWATYKSLTQSGFKLSPAQLEEYVSQAKLFVESERGFAKGALSPYVATIDEYDLNEKVILSQGFQELAAELRSEDAKARVDQTVNDMDLFNSIPSSISNEESAEADTIFK